MMHRPESLSLQALLWPPRRLWPSRRWCEVDGEVRISRAPYELTGSWQSITLEATAWKLSRLLSHGKEHACLMQRVLSCLSLPDGTTSATHARRLLTPASSARLTVKMLHQGPGRSAHTCGACWCR